MFKRILSIFVLVTAHSLYSDQLTPPQCNPTDIIAATSCDRPRRKDGINISLEHNHNKMIVHCYGHGGSGFTTLFGSVDKAVELLLTQQSDTQAPIRIIGSGCMGLTMALELYRRGFTNIVISTKEKYNLPSWRAGGWFDPGTGEETDPVDVFHLNLGLATCATLQTIEQGLHPYLTPAVVERLPIYFPASIKTGVEVLEQRNIMPPSELVSLDFGNGIVHEHYKKQETYFINVCELMKQLWATVDALQIPVITQEVRSFSECPEAIICNCTGLGSSTLNNDAALYPARGHFFMLTSQADNSSFKYMLFTKVGENKEWIYWFPKSTFVDSSGTATECCGMLGGTNIAYGDMNEEELRALDEQEFKKLAERTQKFFYGESAQETAVA